MQLMDSSSVQFTPKLSSKIILVFLCNYGDTGKILVMENGYDWITKIIDALQVKYTGGSVIDSYDWQWNQQIVVLD